MAFLTQALDREGPFSPMGGEIQLWLALGYQVTIHHQVCFVCVPVCIRRCKRGHGVAAK